MTQRLYQSAASAAEACALMREWILAECRVISDTSADIRADQLALIKRARHRALQLGLFWQDDFVPDYVLADLGEEGHG